MDVFTSSEVAAMRIFIAFLFLLPFAFWHITKDILKRYKPILVTAVIGNFIPAFLFTKAETVIDSSLAGMLNSLSPLFTLTLGVLFFQMKASRTNVVGIFVGFAGAFGLAAAGTTGHFESSLLYVSYVLIATFFYGISVNVIKRYLEDLNPVAISVCAMLFVGPLAGIYLYGFTDFHHRLFTHPGASTSLFYVCILAIIGTAISIILYNVLIRNTTALFASSVTYLIPVVAVLWGLLDGEVIRASYPLWIGLILVGVYLVNKKKV